MLAGGCEGVLRSDVGGDSRAAQRRIIPELSATPAALRGSTSGDPRVGEGEGEAGDA